MLGPRVLLNGLSVATFVMKPPMMKLLTNDIQRPMYHLILVRRLRRIFMATFGDPHNGIEIIEELLEDISPSIVDVFVWGEGVVYLLALLVYILPWWHSRHN